MAECKGVHNLLGDIEAALAGTFQTLQCRKQAQTQPRAFACRLNHRFDARKLIEQLIDRAIQNRPVQGTVNRESHVQARFQSDPSVNHWKQQR